MNKRIMLGTLCALFGLTTVSAQTEFRDISLNEALTAAQAEGKLVFVDCYTEWCGPCKQMAAKEFPKAEAGEYFNPKFVCIKIDMEKGDGPEIGKKYSVGAFPTFLILNPDGELRGRFVGYATMDKFITKVENTLKEEKGLPWYMAKFKEGERDQQFLKEYTRLLSENYMREELKKVAEILFADKTGQEIAADQELFSVFSMADFSPYDDIFLKVYKERATVLAAQGERVAQNLDANWQCWGLGCMKFEGKEYKGFDQEKFEAYKQLMAENGVPDADGVAQYILRTNATYAKDYPTIYKYLEQDLQQADDQIEDNKLLQHLNLLASGYKTDKKAVKTMKKFVQRRIGYLQKKDTTGEREFELEGKKTTITGYMLSQYQEVLGELNKK